MKKPLITRRKNLLSVLFSGQFLFVLILLGIIHVNWDALVETVYTIPRMNAIANTVMITLDKNSGASGVIVKHGGKRFILTNNHVCSLGIGKYLVVESNARIKTIVSFIQRSKKHDLCKIKLSDNQFSNLNGVQLSSFSISPRKNAIVVGYPLLLPQIVSKGEAQNLVIIGIRSGLFSPTVEYTSQIFTNLTYPGSSGSPIFNSRYQLTNLVFAGIGGALSFTFAVPYSAIRTFLDEEVEFLPWESLRTIKIPQKEGNSEEEFLKWLEDLLGRLPR